MMVESSMVEDSLTALSRWFEEIPKIIDTVSLHLQSDKDSGDHNCEFNIRVISEILRFK